MQAPKIARDTSPFFWTYIDRPESGNAFLTWQPLQQMGVNFASDGLIWPPQEQYIPQEVGNGVVCCLANSLTVSYWLILPFIDPRDVFS